MKTRRLAFCIALVVLAPFARANDEALYFRLSVGPGPGHVVEGRVLASNAVAVPIDSALFVWLAFGGLLPGSEALATGVLVSIFWANVLIKGAITLVSIPGIYLVRPTPLPPADAVRLD